MINVVIAGELTDLNAYINAQRANKFGGNQLKQNNTEKCRGAFLLAKAAGLKIKTPVTLDITWYCKNKRKDKDNIAFAIKFIFDGMIAAGVIPNDGWSEIKGFNHHFAVDKDCPRVEIKLEESKC